MADFDEMKLFDYGEDDDSGFDFNNEPEEESEYGVDEEDFSFEEEFSFDDESEEESEYGVEEDEFDGSGELEEEEIFDLDEEIDLDESETSHSNLDMEGSDSTSPRDLEASLSIDKGSFRLSMGTISISDIVIPKMVKDSRKETYLGLTRSVEELGVLCPIHVMVSEGYAEHLEEAPDEEYDGPKYVLLDGLRRLFALKKNGLERVNVIYDFEDKDKGSDMLNILSLILNKEQRRSWAEIWFMYQTLDEGESVLSPNNVEYLLQLEPGDAMKLKEVMTRSDEFPEPAEDLLAKKKNLQQAYNALMKAMKEQNQLAKEDVSGVSELDETEGVVDDARSDGKLSDQEVKEILDMEDSFNGELSDDDFDELMGNNLPDERQTSGDRHPLDPALRAAVLQRDGYCCQITGRGKGLPAPIALSILNVHHKIPVHCGGTDTMDNLITICLDAHTLIHVIERNNGKLGMSKDQFDSLSEEDRNFIMGVMKIARIAVEANRRQGRTREQIYKDTSDAVRFQMPGKIQKENMDAIAVANSRNEE